MVTKHYFCRLRDLTDIIELTSPAVLSKTQIANDSLLPPKSRDKNILRLMMITWIWRKHTKTFVFL